MDPKQLREIAFFEGFSDQEVKQMTRWIEEVDVPAGRPSWNRGSFPSGFFVIREGTADVTQDGETIRSLGLGDFFGEIALIETHRRTASVVGTSPMKLVVLDGHEFRAMEAELPHAAEVIRAHIEERLENDADA